MKRDWDKLRRRETARQGCRSLTGIAYDKKQKRSRSSRKAARRFIRSLTPKPNPPAQRPHTRQRRLILTITGPNFHAVSTWTGPSLSELTCIRADPAVEWFFRVRHVSAIADWLSTRGPQFSHKWENIKHTAAQAEPAPPLPVLEPENTAAEAYTGNTPASGLFHANSCPSPSINLESGDHRTRSGSSIEAGAVGRYQSSPHNCSGVSPITADSVLSAH